MRKYQKKKDEVWCKAQIIEGRNPCLYRMDKFGNVINYKDYGKNTKRGWQIDHGRPVSKGGTDHLNNLNAVQSAENRKKGNTYPYRPIKKNQSEESEFPWGTAILSVLGLFLLGRA